MHLVARVIAFCFLLLRSLTASADSLTGKVVKITDGDTLYVVDANYKEHKIRLAEKVGTKEFWFGVDAG
jgi:endonuclease YncB( thermonuclease family)